MILVLYTKGKQKNYVYNIYTDVGIVPQEQFPKLEMRSTNTGDICKIVFENEMFEKYPTFHDLGK